jgi:glycosyltransferase involved in cell wall biosynthesis
MAQYDLSVLIPVYNEIASIETLLDVVQAALPGANKELVIVDDGSTDGTRQWLANTFTVTYERDLPGNGAPLSGKSQFTKTSAVRVIFHEHNKGKGGAIQTAMAASSGDIIVIQDADLEYDPADWQLMYELIAQRKVADVVYGSRFYGRAHRSLYYHHYLANRLISLLFNIMFNQTLTDIEVCYKMFTREVLQNLRITATDFGIEVQISAQIALARRWRIYEVGIHYFGRTYDEGKKINWKDGVKALGYLVKYRFKPGN